MVVGLFREFVSPSSVWPLLSFLVVLVAVMERHHRSLIYLPVETVPEFPDPAE